MARGVKLSLVLTISLCSTFVVYLVMVIVNKFIFDIYITLDTSTTPDTHTTSDTHTTYNGTQAPRYCGLLRNKLGILIHSLVQLSIAILALFFLIRSCIDPNEDLDFFICVSYRIYHLCGKWARLMLSRSRLLSQIFLPSRVFFVNPFICSLNASGLYILESLEPRRLYLLDSPYTQLNSTSQDLRLPLVLRTSRKGNIIRHSLRLYFTWNYMNSSIYVFQKLSQMRTFSVKSVWWTVP